LIIDNQKALNEFCRQLLDCKTISVDTEFLRKNTLICKNELNKSIMFNTLVKSYRREEFRVTKYKLLKL
ncbi:MAG: hypothetical protein ACJBCI_03510, partial [Candidatus Tisiphia sp.]